MALEKTNDCYFVGDLVEVKKADPVTYTGKNGQPVEAISVSIVVKCMIGEEENVFSLDSFTNKVNANGAPNKNYSKLVNIKDLLGKKVTIAHASFDSTRFYSVRDEQLRPSVKFKFNMIREANAAEIKDGDKATFSYGGFVVRELTERMDDDGNITHYQMTLGQANYRDTNMSLIDFVVDKDNVKAVQVMQDKYVQGATIVIRGECRNVVTTRTETTESMFGEPQTKVYTTNDRKYVIKSGDVPIEGEGEYTVDTIKTLNKAYVSEGEEIVRKAKESADGNTESAPAQKSPATKKTALSGLFD